MIILTLRTFQSQAFSEHYWQFIHFCALKVQQHCWIISLLVLYNKFRLIYLIFERYTNLKKGRILVYNNACSKVMQHPVMLRRCWSVYLIVMSVLFKFNKIILDFVRFLKNALICGGRYSEIRCSFPQMMALTGTFAVWEILQNTSFCGILFHFFMFVFHIFDYKTSRCF